MNLTDINISYILLECNNMNALSSVLYSKNYNIIPIQSYFKGIFNESILAYSNIDNDELRNDLIFLMEEFNINSAVIKYVNESVTHRMNYDGSDCLLEVKLYNTNDDLKSYLYNGISFSYIESTRYWTPKSENDLKTGMIVEYQNKNKWNKYKIRNPHKDYEDMLKLFMKYNKVRVSSN